MAIVKDGIIYSVYASSIESHHSPFDDNSQNSANKSSTCTLNVPEDTEGLTPEHSKVEVKMKSEATKQDKKKKVENTNIISMTMISAANTFHADYVDAHCTFMYNKKKNPNTVFFEFRKQVQYARQCFDLEVAKSLGKTLKNKKLLSFKHLKKVGNNVIVRVHSKRRTKEISAKANLNSTTQYYLAMNYAIYEANLAIQYLLKQIYDKYLNAKSKTFLHLKDISVPERRNIEKQHILFLKYFKENSLSNEIEITADDLFNICEFETIASEIVPLIEENQRLKGKKTANSKKHEEESSELVFIKTQKISEILLEIQKYKVLNHAQDVYQSQRIRENLNFLEKFLITHMNEQQQDAAVKKELTRALEKHLSLLSINSKENSAKDPIKSVLQRTIEFYSKCDGNEKTLKQKKSENPDEALKKYLFRSHF